MPLLGKKIFVCARQPANPRLEEAAYTVPYTGEQFRSKEEYERRLALYQNRVWTCQSTGHANLTHEEAWNSEKAVQKTLRSQFDECFEKPVLEVVHHSTLSLDTLVDQAWLKLHQVLCLNENVFLKIKGCVIKAYIIRIDTCGIEVNPTSNCSSPSSDKENTDDTNAATSAAAAKDKDGSQKKWVPPKLLPYKYSIKLDGEDKIINSVPAADISRIDKAPSKELLRLFIRTHALRAGVTSTSPWVVDEKMVKKHCLQNKVADVFLSPIKFVDNVPKSLNAVSSTNVKKRKSNSKLSSSVTSAKKQKLNKMKKRKSSSSSKKENQKREKKQKKLVSSPVAKRTGNAGVPKKGTPLKKKLGVWMDTDSDSDDCVLLELKNKSTEEDALDDLPLIALKNQKTPTKVPKLDRKSITPKLHKSPKPGSKLSTPTRGPKLSKSPKKPSKNCVKKKRDSKGTKIGKDMVAKRARKGVTEHKDVKSAQRNRVKNTPKKKGMKQMTLLEMSTKKTPRKSPEKRRVTSPQKPAIVQALMRAWKTKDSNKGTYKSILHKAVRQLNTHQRAQLPPEIKDTVQRAYTIFDEKRKLQSMTAEERDIYQRKKREEMRKKAAAQRRERKEQQRKERQELNKRFEDQELEHVSLPVAKVVPTPDGLPVEAFGDVTMITEFIGCYSCLFMPHENYSVNADSLMNALVLGPTGFVYLCRLLVILLQTLLQDEIAENYSELNVALTDIPVNIYTASELVRLCLRKNDAGDVETKSDDSEDSSNIDYEVDEGLIQQLETSELFSMEPMQKLQVLKGLFLRILNTYSVQDYMEQKQIEAVEAWKRKISNMKEKKRKKSRKMMGRSEEPLKEKEDSSSQERKKEESNEDKKAGFTITDFYGNKPVRENASQVKDEGVEDDGLVSVLRRRRRMTLLAVAEREKREQEERERREKEAQEQRRQREIDASEKSFNEKMTLAKLVHRISPIGTDRYNNRYWIFSHSAPGVYIEKGWVNSDITYSVQSQETLDLSDETFDDEDYLSSSDEEVMVRNNKVTETIAPTCGQNLWFIYDTMKDVDALIESMHPQGIREGSLKMALQKKRDYISKAFNAANRIICKFPECDGNAELVIGYKKELMETERRLRNGGLGGVDIFAEWEVKLSKAQTIPELAACMLDTQSCVFPRFFQGILSKRRLIKKKLQDNVGEVADDVAKESPDVTTSKPLSPVTEAASCLQDEKVEDPKSVSDDCNSEKEEVDEEEYINVGIMKWRDAVDSCYTMSRLHVLLGVLDACIKWEKSAENVKCKICRKRNDDAKLLLCDECNQPFHLYCLRPALLQIPDGEWYCPACVPQSQRRRTRGDTAMTLYSQDRSSRNYREESESENECDLESVDHEQNCNVCGGDESLIYCSQCPSVYHIECHDPPLRHPPRGQWICSSCRNGKRWRKRSGFMRKVKKNLSKSKYLEKSDSSKDDDDDDDDDDYGSGQRYLSDDTDSEKSQSEAGTQTGYCKTSQKSSAGTQTISSDRYTNRSNASRLAIYSNIISRLVRNKASWPFNEPVSKKQVPDYYDVIKNPMDFQTITNKCLCDSYTCNEDFIADVTLVFCNAAIYNTVDSEVYQSMLTLEKQFIELLARHLPNCHYSRKKTNGYRDYGYTCYGTRKRGYRI